MGRLGVEKPQSPALDPGPVTHSPGAWRVPTSQCLVGTSSHDRCLTRLDRSVGTTRGKGGEGG